MPVRPLLKRTGYGKKGGRKMKKHLWKRILTAGCVASLFMTSPGVLVLADELPGEVAVDSDSLTDESEHLDTMADVGATTVETPEADKVVVGDGVTATYGAGEVVFYSNGGTLWNNWFNIISAKFHVQRVDIKSIKVSKTAGIVYLPSDSSWLFAGEGGWKEDGYYFMDGLETLDMSGFNTSKVTDMSHMFSGRNELNILDLSNFDTSSVMNLSYMFSGCDKLTRLDFSGFDTSNVVSMNSMFESCERLEDLDLKSFETSKVTNMSKMFQNCGSLKDLDLSNFNTANVTDMSSMFFGCDWLHNLDVSNFDTSKVTNMSGMFAGCQNLSALNLSGFDTGCVTDMSEMFGSRYWADRGVDYITGGCNSLSELDLRGFNTSRVTDMTRMFYGCGNLAKLDIRDFDMSNVIRTNEALYYCWNLEILRTPKKYDGYISLPITMYDKEGNTYDSLYNLSKSILLASSQQLAGETSSPVAGVKIDKDAITINKGNSIKLNVAVLPDTAFNKNVIWTSSDETVATVDENGLVTAVSEGSADITVTTDDGGFTAVCKVEIAKKIEFKDVADEKLWYYDSVYWAVRNNVTSGMGEGTFQPMAKLSRAQAVTFLYNLAGRPDVSGLQAKEFTDVSKTAWYYNAVKWAVANKITSGYGTGTFQPNATCNRAMIVTFLANYAKAAGTYKEPTTSASFKDVKAKDWFKKSVDWAVENGITSGYGQGTFSPNVTCNRAMMVTFLKKVAELPTV